MTKQIACLFTNYLGDGSMANPYRPRFVDAMQIGEAWAFNLVDLLSEVSQYEAVLPSSDLVAKHGVPQGFSNSGLAMVYIYAEHTRIDTADTSPHYHAFWRYTINRADPLAASDLLPTTNPSTAEVTAIRDYLALQTGKTGTQITGWFKNRFGVASNAEAVAWATSRSRAEFTAKMAQAFEMWSSTRAELNAL